MRYQQNPAIAWREIEGEAVLVDSSEGRLLVLNPTGLVLWQLLETSQSEESLATALVKNFDVGPGQAREDVQGFLEALSSRKLIQTIPSSSG